MKPAQCSLLRDIMTTAWEFFRSAAKRGEPFACFGDSLRSAWRFVRSNLEFVRKYQGHPVRFSSSLIRSPIARASGRNGRADFSAAYMTAKLSG
jgi:hypothetical protein